MNFYCCVDGNVSPSTIHTHFTFLFCMDNYELSMMYCGHQLWSVYSMAFTVLGFFLNVSGVIASCNVYIVICSNGKRTWMTFSTYSAFSLSFKLYILFNFLFLCVEAQISSCVSEGSIVLRYMLLNCKCQPRLLFFTSAVFEIRMIYSKPLHWFIGKFPFYVF